MQSISNYDNYRIVQQNHDNAKRNRQMERDRHLCRTARAIEITVVLFTVFSALGFLARFG